MALDSAGGIDEPGPVFEGYTNDPEGAIRRLMREKRGQVKGVWHKAGLGRIDLIYGTDKAGLSKIARKHVDADYDAIARLPELLKRGKVVRSPNRSKAFIVTDSRPAEVAVIALDWHGRRKAWVLSAYLDVQGQFTGRVERMNADALDGVRADILPTDPRTTRSTLPETVGGFQ